MLPATKAFRRTGLQPRSFTSLQSALSLTTISRHPRRWLPCACHTARSLETLRFHFHQSTVFATASRRSPDDPPSCLCAIHPTLTDSANAPHRVALRTVALPSSASPTRMTNLASYRLLSVAHLFLPPPAAAGVSRNATAIPVHASQSSVQHRPAAYHA